MKLTVIRNRRLFSDPNFGPFDQPRLCRQPSVHWIGILRTIRPTRDPRADPGHGQQPRRGFAELWVTRHSRRHTPKTSPDGSELSTFFLDPRRPLHPLHQSFTYEPKQILWHLKSKPLGTAQISTAWFVAFYDP